MVASKCRRRGCLGGAVMEARIVEGIWTVKACIVEGIWTVKASGRPRRGCLAGVGTAEAS